jgi:hypothetical protein
MAERATNTVSPDDSGLSTGQRSMIRHHEIFKATKLCSGCGKRPSTDAVVYHGQIKAFCISCLPVNRPPRPVSRQSTASAEISDEGRIKLAHAKARVLLLAHPSR